MATLHVENVPDELYNALRKRAEDNGRSITDEVIDVLESCVPTGEELERRLRWLEQSERIRSMPSPSPGPFPSAEEMIREDRER